MSSLLTRAQIIKAKQLLDSYDKIKRYTITSKKKFYITTANSLGYTSSKIEVLAVTSITAKELELIFSKRLKNIEAELIKMGVSYE